MIYAYSTLLNEKARLQERLKELKRVEDSEVDLIALKNNKTYKIQVKTSFCNNRGSLQADLRKSNRKNGGYTKDSFDILAIVDVDKNKVAYFKWENVYDRTKLTLRTNTYIHKIDSNTGSKGFMLFDDYLEFPIAV